MKKINMLAVALLTGASVLSVTGCSSKSEKAADDSTIESLQNEEPIIAPAELDSVAKIFTDPARASEVATDSTYATTESGLKYMVLRTGTGKSPKATDEVTVHYEGKLTNGYTFDSSYDRGEPATFPLNRVIPGWTEGLQLMKTGGKTVFYIPSELGYGARGAGEAIPPNSDLIFTVELLEVNN